MGIVKLKSQFLTVDELIRELGVPASRIRMTPLPGTATEKDLLRTNGRKDGIFELVDGVLVEKSMGFWECVIGNQLGALLRAYVHSGALGIVAGAQAEHRLRRGLVRLPDVSFVSWDQLPDFKVPEEAVPNLYPDIAVEVYSRGNRRKEMARKRREYFRAGTRLVWIVYPKTETVEVYTSPTEFRTLGIGDTLDGGDVLPGFQLAVRDVFAPPPAPPRPPKSRNGKKK